jgi:hypothetical protein
MKYKILQTKFKTKLEYKCKYFNIRAAPFVEDFFGNYDIYSEAGCRQFEALV